MEVDSPPGLAADIGGTNARFALVRGTGAAMRLLDERRLACTDHGTLAEAVEAYLAMAAPRARPRRAVIAIAGPVGGDVFRMTNIAWSFSVRETAARLGLDSLRLVNDFTAIARALPGLGASDLVRIGGPDLPPAESAGATLAVLGPGTGLGVGGLVRDGRGDTVMASEGGHVAFAPLDETERGIERILRGRFGRVSWERLLSGPGLVALHAAMAEIEGVAAEALRPDELTARAAGGDAFAERVLLRFCALLGSFAGDIALAFGAWGGVYIAGGVVPRFTDLLARSDFRQRFEDKGRFRDRLAAVPTRVIVHPDPGLVGAARMLASEISPG